MEVFEQIMDAVMDIAGEKTLRAWPSPSSSISFHMKQPDFAIGPRGHEFERIARKDTTVVEVAYLHGSRENLK